MPKKKEPTYIHLNDRQRKFMSEHPKRLYSGPEGLFCVWCKTDHYIKPEKVFGKLMCHRCERFDVIEVK